MSRLILEPTKADKLQGDLMTGKRLNMRKVIPYNASQFKKDKIWLRRVKPNKRQFQVGPLPTLSPPLTCHSPRSWWPSTTAPLECLQSLATISSALARHQALHPTQDIVCPVSSKAMKM